MIAVLALSGVIAEPCRAIDLAAIEALAGQGKKKEALRRLESELAPDDLPGQLLRAFLLASLGKTVEATRAFRQLSQQYPDRPEPRHNWAVLRAQGGDDWAAITALQDVVTHYPTYETAASNLELILLTAADEDFDPLVAGAQRPTLTLTNRLGSYPRVDPLPPPDPTVADSGEQGIGVVPTPPPEQTTGSASPTPAIPTMGVEAEPTTQPAALSQALAAEPSPEPGAAQSAAQSPRAELEHVVTAWAAAWSEQRIKEYLAFYAADFEPTGYASRQAWETVRRQRLAAPAFIEVKVDLETSTVRETGPGEASVTFTQSYRSDSFSDTVEKTLDMVREVGAWRIRRETSR